MEKWYPIYKINIKQAKSENIPNFDNLYMKTNYIPITTQINLP